MAGFFSKEFWLGGPSGAQQRLTRQLRDRAEGRTSSAAEIMMQRGMGTAQRGAMSTAASVRGMNPGVAARMALSQQGQMASSFGAQMGAMRAQEQARAEALLQKQVNTNAQAGPGFFGNLLGSGMQAAGAYFGAGGGRGQGGGQGSPVGAENVRQWSDYGLGTGSAYAGWGGGSSWPQGTDPGPMSAARAYPGSNWGK